MKQEQQRRIAEETSHQLPTDKTNKNSTKEEKSIPFAISRRTFLGTSAFAAAAFAATYVTNRPEVNLVLPPGDITQESFTEQWIATSCLNCSTRCATNVRVVNGKAVRISGNALSKFSEGATCPRSHVGLQVLYNPDRVEGPLKRTNPVKGRDVDAKWVSISWDQALGEVSGRLKALREKDQPQKLLFLHGLNSISNEDLIRRFGSAYGTPNVISRDAFENEAEKAGEWMADGHYTHSAYDLERTNYILAFGASLVESQRPLARNLRMWGKIRRERPNRAKVVVIDPRYSVTAAKADQWIPINPGTDGALAMAIANVIINEGLYDADFIENWTDGFDEYKEIALRDNSPELAAEITGIDADAIRQIAREFAGTRPAVAWRGRGATCWPNGSYTSYAIFCLNALVGSIDAPGGILYQEYPVYTDMPELVDDDVARRGRSQASLDFRMTDLFPVAEVVTNQVADSILEDKPYPVEVAIGFNSNFNMTAPGTSRWDEAMAKVPYYVHVASAMTEMAQYADIILPSCTFLEEWGYDHSPPGSGFAEAKIKQPVIEILYDSKPMPDIVFELANRLGGVVAQAFSGIGGSAEGFTRYRTGNFIPWDEFREKGVWVGSNYEYHKYNRIFDTPSSKFEFRSGNLETALKERGNTAIESGIYMPDYKPVEFLGDVAEYPLVLATYHPLLDICNGNQNYPWAQEIYMVMHGQGWNNFIEINAKTARSLRVKDGDMIWVESPFNRIKSKARVIEGIHPQVVAVANGQGHYANGRWADGIGVNPNDIVGIDYDRISGQSSLFNTRVKVYKA